MIRADGIRLRDLSIGGWLGLALVLVGLYAIGTGLIGILADLAFGTSIDDTLARVVVGGIVGLAGAGIAYENGSAEVEEACQSCGETVRVRSSRDGLDEAVVVRAATTPKRLDIGPLSVVTSRRRYERVYCSGECASRDERLYLDTPATSEDLAARSSEVPGDD